MAMDQSSIVFTDDGNGIYSVSDFLNYMPDQLCCWESFAHLKLFFWNRGHLALLKKKGTESINENIKYTIQSLGISYIPTLVQFWAPNYINSEQFLETFDFPFGISFLRKGLCWYRKRCLNYKYRVDGESSEEEYGPIGRVFRNGFLEFNPDVSLYSVKEYKLKDFAVFCGVKGYLALPVFESKGQNCVGVLELLSIFDGSYSLTDQIVKVNEALKAVGLRSSKICSPFDMEMSTEHEFALTEIKQVLEAACCAYKLPFAQAWFSSKDKNCCGDFLCTSEKGSFMLAKSVSPFQKECIRLCLKKGENVVWRAFESRTSCFCRDIKQLRTKEYSLVYIARKCHLTSCFAICLQSIDGSDIYVLEFFLPSIQLIDREPQVFFISLLATVKNHLKSFMVASGQELGAEFSVEVIKLCAATEVDSFKISLNCRSPEVSQNQVPKMKPSSSESNGKHHLSKEGNTSQIKVASSHCPKELGNTAGSGLHSRSKSDIFHTRPKDLHKRKSDYGNKAPPNKRKADHSLSQQEDIARPVPQATFNQIESPVMIKASYEENIIKFRISLTSGIRDFEDEVYKRLDLKPGSYEIKHLNDDHSRQTSLGSDEDLQNFMRRMISEKKTSIKLVLEPVKIQEINNCSNFVDCPLPQTAEIKTAESLMLLVKVTHNDDTIKFNLSLSAGIMELKGEVMKRLNLNGTSFGIKYFDDEENKWINIESDTHLQNYMRSKQTTTLRFSTVVFTK